MPAARGWDRWKHIPSRGWHSIFELNIHSAYYCTREAGKHMIEQRSGAIVNISSGAGMNGVKGGAHYSAAKAALQMFTRVTAAEWGRFGIRANCVAAGAIASERVLEAWKVAGLDPDEMGAAIPLGRTGTPDEIANMIVFFASDAASYITGQTIGVDGGPALGGISARLRMNHGPKLRSTRNLPPCGRPDPRDRGAREVGSDDFGPDDYLSGLKALLQSMDYDPHFSEQGRRISWAQSDRNAQGPRPCDQVDEGEPRLRCASRWSALSSSSACRAPGRRRCTG